MSVSKIRIRLDRGLVEELRSLVAPDADLTTLIENQLREAIDRRRESTAPHDAAGEPAAP